MESKPGENILSRAYWDITTHMKMVPNQATEILWTERDTVTHDSNFRIFYHKAKCENPFSIGCYTPLKIYIHV